MTSEFIWAIAVLYAAAFAMVVCGSALLAEGARDEEFIEPRVGGVIAIAAGILIALYLTVSLAHPDVLPQQLLALKGEWR